VTFQRGETVLTTHPRTDGVVDMPVRAGCVVAVNEINDSYWLDLNHLGRHLPQMYYGDELQLATPELAGTFALCPPCAGYGVAISGEECTVCYGSGSTEHWVTPRSQRMRAEEVSCES
jgi:hypothetical protein